MKLIGVAVLLLLAACSTVGDKKVDPGVDLPQASADAEKSDDQLLDEGIELLNRGRPKQAIDDYFDPIISRCDAQYKDTKEKVYAARGQKEAIYYMALAVAVGQKASVVYPLCADALYFKGYANLDLGKIEEAMVLVNRALVWSPVNAMYLSELAHLHQAKREWAKAMEIYEQAEDHAQAFTPEPLRLRELSRAKRGIGFTLIELGKLDEAEAKFLECLELDEKDQGALHELEYIRHLKLNAVKS
jgi:tetratricopeptide (TPR) repeat protein